MILKFLCSIVVLVLFHVALFAQLNGIYTIGGVSPDYSSFASAVNALTGGGISGPVVFNVRSGTYEEKISIGAINGSTAVNTVTFQSEAGDSTAVVLTDSNTTVPGNNYTLRLNGADHLIFQKITIRRTGTGMYANVIEISNGANGNYFASNQIIGIAATSSSTLNSLIYSPPGMASNDSGNVFTGNDFENGSYGMYYNGQGSTLTESKTRIVNNVFHNQYARFISMLYESDPLVAGNRCMANSSYAAMYGIYLSFGAGGMVGGNTMMIASGSGYGMYLTDERSDTTLPLMLVNNMVHLGGSASIYGVVLNGCSNIGLYYNSICLSGTGATSRCIEVAGTVTSGIQMLDNIFFTTSGLAIYVASSAVSGIQASDYNDYYTSGTMLGFFGSAIPDLAALQSVSGMDLNSVSTDPGFYSFTDLHISGPALNNLGTAIPAINADIDGEARNAVTPDPGADEFNPLISNVGIFTLMAPTSGSCGDSSAVIGVVIKNAGANPQSGIPASVELTGAITQTLTGTYSGTLLPEETDTLFFSQAVNTNASGLVNLTAYTSLPGDQYAGNDTLRSVRTWYAVPGAPLVISPQVQCDNNVSIAAVADSGNILSWYDQPGGNLLYSGNPFSPNIFSDTTFYVAQRLGSGTLGCLRITECGLGSPAYLEIENVSGNTIDASGWTAMISNSFSDINIVNPVSWNLGMLNPGEIVYRTDGINDYYWGNNMLWNPGNKGWAMIVDNAGNVIDFVSWGWTDAEIQSLFVIANGFPVQVGLQWTGNGALACPAPDAISRWGNEDHNDATDFVCAAETKGQQNVNLAGTFSNCGLGLCSSILVPLEINLVPGISVTLGNDTILQPPFSFILDAGPGYTSYLWNTSESTQSITVNNPGIYWVTVTGGPYDCAATDSIVIDAVVGVNIVEGNSLELFPNPAAEKLVIAGFSREDQWIEISIQDISGREVTRKKIYSERSSIKLDISFLSPGLYLLKAGTIEKNFNVKLMVQH